MQMNFLLNLISEVERVRDLGRDDDIISRSEDSFAYMRACIFIRVYICK